MKLSVLIPAHNEEGSIENTVTGIYQALQLERISHEILVVNDHSQDQTGEILAKLTDEIPTLRQVENLGASGFGFAVRYGLDEFTGDAVAIMMADLSDSPKDLVRFFHKMEEGEYDCVFGSRFINGATLVGYPRLKRVINRLANTLIRIMMGIKYNDTTNAFKLYRREVIQGLRPFLSPHFNLTIELPLKAIIRGYSYTVLPNSWTNRKEGESKLSLREMGSRYLFILLYCLIEKYFSKGDFKKKW